MQPITESIRQFNEVKLNLIDCLQAINQDPKKTLDIVRKYQPAVLGHLTDDAIGRQVFDWIQPIFTLFNFDSDFVLKWGQRFFFAINEKLRNAKRI